MLNGADVARSALNVQTQHETSSDISFVQVCDGLNVEWANAQLNFVCIIHGLERGRGGVVEGILISHPALFSSQRISVRYRLALSIDVLNYTLV